MALDGIYFTCFLGRFNKLALDNIGCVRHSSSKLGSALTGTMFDDTLLYLREDFFVRLQQHSGLWCQPTLEARAEAKICLDYALQGGGRRSQRRRKSRRLNCPKWQEAGGHIHKDKGVSCALVLTF